MTTSTAPSAYPFDLSDLLPRARDLAETIGAIPSRNQLMRELRVGAPKATALREALQIAELTTTPPVRIPDPEPLPDIDNTPEPEPVPVADPILDLIEHLPDPPAVVVDGVPEPAPLPTGDGHPAASPVSAPVPTSVAVPAVRKPVRSWPVLLLALPAFVAIWSGWVGLGEQSGFGIVHPLPGIWDQAHLNTAITLPIGVETYAAYALHVWLSSGIARGKTRRFAKWSAIGSLLLGMAGQGAYHLMTAYGVTQAPWPIVTLVSCLPVAVLGMGAALAHLVRNDADH